MLRVFDLTARPLFSLFNGETFLWIRRGRRLSTKDTSESQASSSAQRAPRDTAVCESEILRASHRKRLDSRGSLWIALWNLEGFPVPSSLGRIGCQASRSSWRDVGRVCETLAIGSWGRDGGHHSVLMMMGINALGSVAVMFGSSKRSMIPIVAPTGFDQ